MSGLKMRVRAAKIAELRTLAARTLADTYEPGWPYGGGGPAVWSSCIDGVLGGPAGAYCAGRPPRPVGDAPRRVGATAQGGSYAMMAIGKDDILRYGRFGDGDPVILGRIRDYGAVEIYASGLTYPDFDAACAGVGGVPTRRVSDV